MLWKRARTDTPVDVVPTASRSVAISTAPSHALRDSFRQHIDGTPAEHDGAEIALSSSIGLAQLEPDESIGSWIERADQALYSAKQAGRTQVAFARPADPVPAPPAAPPTEDASGREAAG